ncbi:glycoside hydrolase family 85 protein [Hydnomerulius pinastri MD-312]|uniref:Glycoside hydrolase family 85 protein n=1 Tax=Hydnomerulius pinastri MD-312 TaxID=994086 RepID=A0A0C9W882_9AGAM|nr:glycoside hydrolase family 85 protein [Hydnomerulius pinastri MD-312]
MPLRGVGHSRLVGDEEPYFKSLAELDAWFAQPHAKLSGVLGYQSRPLTEGQSGSRGKLLVCHDYKGGYTESPAGLCYTFNFWSLCDTFVYFSHHRITVPPSGWTNAAHKQGTKMLGTLIFEGGAEADCLQLIVGCAQRTNLGPTTLTGNIPLSKHYAALLAELAYQRGFDGYLLNFECPLKQGGFEEARALTAWITLLRAELQTKVGPHAQAVWYDSVIIDGRLRWQDRLNNYNLPFFLASDAFFTNYTWPPNYPLLTAQYFMSLDPALVNGSSPDTNSLFSAKSLQSIFTGVDVWGRNQYGGGGFNSYRAIHHIDPKSLGLSVAFFGQAWTWESEQDKPGWNWDQWWDYERKLWIGPPNAGDVVPVPDPPKKRPGIPDIDEGPFMPMTAFFEDLPPPDPARFTFYTSFSPGVGHSWFVDGTKVLETEKGWTDVDKQCSIGNLVWPRPNPVWEGDEREEAVPTASSRLDMTDGFNGGNTLKLSFTCAGSTAEDAFFRSIWLPVQSLNVTVQRSYEVCLVYKTTAGDGIDLDFGVSVKALSNESNHTSDVVVEQAIVSELSEGWSQQNLKFTTSSPLGSAQVAAGLVIGFAAEDPSLPCNFSISLGQLAIYPSPPPPPVSVGTPAILWAKFEHSSNRTVPLSVVEGVLTWDTSSSFPRFSSIRTTSPEDPNPAWILEDNPTYRFPTFTYFNIYVLPFTPDTHTMNPTTAVFIGTTGLDGRANRFYVEPQCLPASVEGCSATRFYVQGVTSSGEVLGWDRCAYVDYVKLALGMTVSGVV